MCFSNASNKPCANWRNPISSMAGLSRTGVRCVRDLCVTSAAVLSPLCNYFGTVARTVLYLLLLPAAMVAITAYVLFNKMKKEKI